ncbi:MAG: DUF882 domain-containing protein [Candidatus Margulisiibacteriota bacterium]
MGDLSDHFNLKDFLCKCKECRGGEYKIHLGLVGALELIAEHFQKPVKVLIGFWCEAYNEKLKKEKLSYHVKGKAAHIAIEGVPLAEVFKFAETVPELHGLGFYPQGNFIHVDTRPAEKKDAWVVEGERYSPLSAEKRKQYGLA